MKAHSLSAFLALALFGLVFGASVRAQENTPATVPPSEKSDARPAAAANEDEKDNSKTVVETDSAVPEEKAAVEKANVEESKSAEQVDHPSEETAPKEKKSHKTKRDRLSIAVDGKSNDSGGNRVRVLDDNEVPVDVVVRGNAVAVLGNLTVNGEVKRDAVAVLGDTFINGTVRHNAVAIMGDLTLGPKAHVEGEVISIGGKIHRDSNAYVGGKVHEKEIDQDFDSFDNWWRKTVRLGRPLAIGAHLGWLWIVTAFSVAFYALLALIFPRSICNCGDKLVQQPGLTILAALLGMLALPVLFILLFLTVIGIPVAILLLPLGCILAVFFGKASLYTLVGRKISQDRLHPAVAAIVGALIFVVLSLVPIAGILLSVLVSWVGFGCVILTLFAPKQIPAPSFAGVSPPFVPPPAFVPPVVSEIGVPPPVAVNVPPVVPTPPLVVLLPVISVTTQPRAGFWIRVAAALLDTILIGVLIGVFEAFFHAFGFHPGEGFPVWVVLYSVVMWANRGTTIGGVICGLRVVRLDDRPIDWSVAIVRALGAFLSLAAAGLGFIWVAFDDERQSWHDKIAGTTIVRVPKGTSLL